MGASTSLGLPARVPDPHREPQEAPGPNQLPIEMLRKVLSYLPPSTLLRHCRPVCRRWRDVVDGWDLWRSILPWKHPDLWPVISTCLPPADNPGPCILGRFCERRPIGSKLTANPVGKGEDPRKGIDPRAGGWEGFFFFFAAKTWWLGQRWSLLGGSEGRGHPGNPWDLTRAGGQARNLVTNFFHVTKDLWNCMVLSGSDSSEEEEDLGARLKTSGETSYSPAYR